MTSEASAVADDSSGSAEAPALDLREDGYPHSAIDHRQAKFQIGQIVRHRLFDFRGVIFDVDPVFANSDEWYEAIPEDMRPSKDQPYYHLFAENDKTHYVAYVSEGNLLPDETDAPVSHPDIPDFFEMTPSGGYLLKSGHAH
ncbi:DNA-binding protein [Henriciella pelagia]|uniref:Heat shock protein HspQ n=1 Tax=Henriciella pelagia TaxID=1977912 RepID=A0ABQ1JAH2_9PROT|nr:DNA-binding protein [Henriciella pelagia]